MRRDTLNEFITFMRDAQAAGRSVMVVTSGGDRFNGLVEVASNSLVKINSTGGRRQQTHLLDPHRMISVTSSVRRTVNRRRDEDEDLDDDYDEDDEG